MSTIYSQERLKIRQETRRNGSSEERQTAALEEIADSLLAQRDTLLQIKNILAERLPK